MPVTIVTKSDTTKAIVRRTAVFIKELRNGKYIYIREPYDIVEYDRAHQSGGAVRPTTYMQPFGGRIRLSAPDGSSTTPLKGNAISGTDDDPNSREEIYDEVLVMDRPDPRSPFRHP